MRGSVAEQRETFKIKVVECVNRFAKSWPRVPFKFWFAPFGAAESVGFSSIARTAPKLSSLKLLFGVDLSLKEGVPCIAV